MEERINSYQAEVKQEGKYISGQCGGKAFSVKASLDTEVKINHSYLISLRKTF